MDSSAAAIELTDISLEFGKTHVLDKLTLTVPRGLVFGFLGPNGAGKTSTIRILLGLLRATSGDVRVLGLDPAHDARRVRAGLGVLLEHDGLYDRLTALNNLDYYARIFRVASPANRIEELLRGCGLWDRRHDRVATWSKGMRQKLAVARTLLHRPPLVLLDEPFTGLDPVAAAELRDGITALAREHGTTIFLTSHDLGHVEKICSQVAVLREGAVIAIGAPAKLGAHGGDDEIELRGSGVTADLLATLQSTGIISTFSISGNTARLTCPTTMRSELSVQLQQHGVVVEELRTVQASLEDTFLALMRKAAP